MQWQIEPMPSWPYPETARRKVTPFHASWSSTLELLDREITALQVTGVVAVRVVGKPGDVRRDGMLRAGVRLDHPGVALSFTSAKFGDLTYPCDTFTSRGRESCWQVNVRAIALALEALRRVDRYGVGGRGEQYAGWRAIGPGSSGQAEEFGDVFDAAGALYELVPGGAQMRTDELARAARAAAHPDRHGGDRRLWDRVERALDKLGWSR